MPVANDNLVIAQIINLVSKHALCQPEQLSIETRIGEDLRIVGDDAHELLAEFSTEFAIDMSSIKFEDYFPEEASSNMHYYLTAVAQGKYQNPIVDIIRFVEATFWRLFAKEKNFKTLTIGHLVNVASNGRW